MSRDEAAAMLSRHFFPISKRTLERWPLAIRRVNGRALYETEELIALAQAKLDAAQPVMSGRHQAAA
jgi:hypothetical protein